MCHIPTKEIKTSKEKGLKVYKVVRVQKEEDYTPLINDIKGRSFIYKPISVLKYYSPFTNSEIAIGVTMRDTLHQYSCWKEKELGPGFYHFFKTKKDATAFLKHIRKETGNINFCILVGNVPYGEPYNEGMFIFNDIVFGSIVSRSVYYNGKTYYE